MDLEARDIPSPSLGAYTTMIPVLQASVQDAERYVFATNIPT